MWDVVLVDGFTQSRKTWKVFEGISQLAHALSQSRLLVLFVTQANNMACVHQVLNRIHESKDMADLFGERVVRAREACKMDNMGGHVMIVDFWNARNTKDMLQVVKDHIWNDILIVFDEADQAGVDGTKPRLAFLQAVENVKHRKSTLRAMFVTATIANFSKNVMRCFKDADDLCYDGLVKRIIQDPIVYHWFVEPDRHYVGPSWFASTEGVLQKLVLPDKPKGEHDKNEFAVVRQQAIVKAIATCPDHHQQLALIATSTLCQDHKKMVPDLFEHCAFDVVVELNSDADKEYLAHYRSSRDATIIQTWKIPLSFIQKRMNTCVALPYILQASLFMGTEHESRITATGQKHPTHFEKVLHIHRILQGKRPMDYPKHRVKIALIAGHLAGRGVTFQDPWIDFTCSMLVFTDTKDDVQRGASNAQRFGRACGMLAELYASDHNARPVLIATEKVLKSAIANEQILIEKAKHTNGCVIALKDLVPSSEWELLCKNVKKTIESIKTKDVMTESEPIVTKLVLTKQQAFARVLDLICKSGKDWITVAEIKKRDPPMYAYLNAQNRRTLTEMAADGLLEHNKIAKRWCLVNV